MTGVNLYNGILYVALISHQPSLPEFSFVISPRISTPPLLLKNLSVYRYLWRPVTYDENHRVRFIFFKLWLLFLPLLSRLPATHGPSPPFPFLLSPSVCLFFLPHLHANPPCVASSTFCDRCLSMCFVGSLTGTCSPCRRVLFHGYAAAYITE